jgi:hypothetical protein
MDVILFLLKITTRLALALMGLAATAVVFLINALTGSLAKRAHRNPAPQEAKPQPSPPISDIPMSPVVPPAQAQAPAVHVHVHLEPPAHQAAPPPQPAPVPAATASPTPATILGQPDHKIYLTTGSHLMMEHPRAGDLLEALDRMLYVAAHRDGKPFHLNPALDDSRPADSVHLPPVAEMDEGVFDRTEPCPLPMPDGALWLRRGGRDPHPLAAGLPS